MLKSQRMFTGIVQEVSRIAAIRKSRGAVVAEVTAPRSWRVSLGASVATNGICSTVTRKRNGMMIFAYMPETVGKTSVASWRAGELVNLERSLKADDALEGHLVAGHVDGVGVVTEVRKARSSRILTIQIPESISPLVAHKGSVAVDGVSLTVAEIGPRWFSVALTPYTLAHTNLRLRREGDRVNVEADVIAKYLARFFLHNCQAICAAKRTGIRNPRAPASPHRRRTGVW